MQYFYDKLKLYNEMTYRINHNSPKTEECRIDNNLTDMRVRVFINKMQEMEK